MIITEFSLGRILYPGPQDSAESGTPFTHLDKLHDAKPKNTEYMIKVYIAIKIAATVRLQQQQYRILTSTLAPMVV
jgi:hypothetical protein